MGEVIKCNMTQLQPRIWHDTTTAKYHYLAILVSYFLTIPLPTFLFEPRIYQKQNVSSQFFYTQQFRFSIAEDLALYLTIFRKAIVLPGGLTMGERAIKAVIRGRAKLFRNFNSHANLFSLWTNGLSPSYTFLLCKLTIKSTYI